MARLEALHRCVDIGIERIRQAGTLGEVSGDHQPLADGGYRGINDAEFQFDGRWHGRPAATGNDLAVGVDGTFNEGNGLGTRDRLEARNLAFAGRTGIELVVPVAAAGSGENITDIRLLREGG